MSTIELKNIPTSGAVPGQTRFSSQPPPSAPEVVLHSSSSSPPSWEFSSLSPSEAAAFDAEWDIKSSASFASSHTAGPVALQFPDHLVQHGIRVASRLSSLLAQEGSSVQVVLLADSAYAGCCVDEVAAEHVNASAIIHYGPACLTATARLPVHYVFRHDPATKTEYAQWAAALCPQESHASPDSNPLLDLASQVWSVVAEGVRSVVVCYEVAYGTIAEDVVGALSAAEGGEGRGVVMMKMAIGEEEEEEEEGGETGEGVLYEMGGFSFELESPIEDGKETFVFLTNTEGVEESSPLRTALQMNHPTVPMVVVDVEGRRVEVDRSKTSRALMKRYMMMEKVKSASVIGLLVGTLAVGPYMEVLDELRVLIEAAGRAYYTFVVGKVNVPKLANFAEVDVFVLVSCPLTALVDSREYLKPIVTPYEAFLALTPGAEWTGEYSTDFAATLAVLETRAADAFELQDADAEGEHIVTSLSSNTGRSSIRAFVTRAPGKGSRSTNADGTLVSRSDAKRQLMVSSDSGAAAVLASRSWQGIQAGEAGSSTDDDPSVHTSSEPAMLEQGRSGRAAQYERELQPSDGQ